MTLPPIIPLVLLILGALAVGASDLARLRRPNLVMVAAAALALMAGLAVRADTPLTQIVSDWQPVSVFTAPISFRVDQTAWILGVGLLLTGLATGLSWLAYPGQSRPASRALSLLLIVAALASVYASNLLTLTMAWGLLDMVFVVALLVRSGPQVGRRAAVAIVLNTASTVCVWIATLLIENSHDSLYWHLVNLQSEPRMWLAAAGVLRLGLYPLHQWLPIETSQFTDRSTLLFTVTPMVGLVLWVRLALTHNLPDAPLVPLLGLVSAVVGAVLAWQSHRTRSELPFIALSLIGLAIIDVRVLTTPSTLTTVALTWLLSLTSLFIARGFSRRAMWRSAGAIVAGLTIMGFPGTLGFTARYAMITNLANSGEWAILAGGLLAEALLIATVIRLIFTPGAGGEDQTLGLARQGVYGAAILCAGVPLIVLAVNNSLIPGSASLSNMLSNLSPVTALAWLLPIGVGGVIAWRDLQTAAPLAEATGDDLLNGAEAPMWLRLMRLDWLNVLFSQLVQRTTDILRGLAGVIEGEGGLIWVVVIVIVGVVLTSGALK